MDKQNDFIKYRINQDLRRQFSDYASKVGQSQSALVRGFIKTLVKDESKPSSEKLAHNDRSSN